MNRLYKTSIWRFLSSMLICVIFVSTVLVYPIEAKDTDFSGVTMVATPPDWLSLSIFGEDDPNSWQFQESGTKVRVTHTEVANGTQRIRVRQLYQPKIQPINFVMEDIKAESTNYAIAIAFGNKSNHWYDQAGYLLLYGQDGDFAIIETNQNPETGQAADLNATTVYHTDKLSVLTDGSTLELNMSLEEYGYTISVNGHTYIVPADAENCPIPNPENLYLVFGVMSDFDILDTDDIAKLDYWQQGAGKVSFTLDKETCCQNLETVRSLKPLAKYEAFMTGRGAGYFRPNAPLTRREAIVSIAGVLTERREIEGIYSSDFEDVNETDPDYDAIAFMERCGFLPDFGTRLEPEKPITGDGLLEMFLEDREVSQDTQQALQDLLSGKGSVSRGEAAKAFCLYLGKNMMLDNPSVTFTDISGHQYEDFILLATNEVPVTEQTIEVTSNGTETIQTAIARAIELSKTQDARVTIELADGTYSLTEPITIDGSAYGSYDVVITVKNKENASPVITGNVDVAGSAFTKVSGKNYYSYQLPEASKKDGNWPKFRDLYLNGERLQLAKSKTMTFTKGHTGADGSFQNQFYVNTALLSGISEPGTLELCMNIEWVNKKFRVAQIDTANADTSANVTPLVINEEEWQAYQSGDGNKRDTKGWSYTLENHIALLDEPGEFYYDSENGTIYVYPYGDTMAQATVAYSTVEKLVDLKNVSGVGFEGITFTGTTSNFTTDHGFNGGLGGISAAGAGESEQIKAAAVYGSHTSHISIRNCTFDELGTHGVYLNNGNRNIVLKGNSFTGIAMSAVVMGSQRSLWSPTNGQSNILLDSNYIYDIGTDYPCCPAVCISYVKNIAVTHNEILHTPYSGLMLGWMNTPSMNLSVHNAEVAYNHCEDNLYAMNDGAALYFCGANGLISDKTVYNRVHDNYIKGTGYGNTYTGIYLDMNASNYYVYRNVIDGIVTTHGPIFNQYISDQITYHNTLRENYTTMSSVTSTKAAADRDIQVIENQMVASAAYLPAGARSIIASAGQQEGFKTAIPQKDTEITMTVAEPHITRKKTETAENSVVFTITNHGSETATYYVENMTGGSVTVTAAPLTLASGETGTIPCTVSCATVNSATGVTRELLSLDVVRNDDWRQEYKRVLDVQIGLQVYRSITVPAFEATAQGMKVTYKSSISKKASHEHMLGIANTYYVRDTGVDIKISNIMSENVDDDYSIAVMLGNTYDKWYQDRGYMLIYGKSGRFSIIAADSTIADPDAAKRVVDSDQLKPLEDSLSIHVKLEGDDYKIAVNGHVYTIPAKDELYPLEDVENLYFTFGFMGDKTSYNKTLGYSWLSPESISFVIEDISISHADELVVGTQEIGETYFYVNDGEELPTGYVDDKYIIQWTRTDTNEVVTQYQADLGTERYCADYIDLDMLRVGVQKNLTHDNVYRFIGSVNDTGKYKYSGFVMSNKNPCPEVDADSSCFTHRGNTYYSGIKAVLSQGGEEQTLRTGALYGNTYSKALFIQAFRFSDVVKVPVVYIRAFVELEDGTIVYGDTGVFDRTDEVYKEEDEKEDDIIDLE